MMRRLPDVVVIVDQKREYNAVQECLKLNIPIVSLLDTNCDPDLVDVPIPANDDAIRSIKLILGELVDAICEGRSGQEKDDMAEAMEEMEEEEPVDAGDASFLEEVEEEEAEDLPDEVDL